MIWTNNKWWIECGWVESSKIEMLICVFKRDLAHKTHSFLIIFAKGYIFKYTTNVACSPKFNDHVQHLFAIWLLPQMYNWLLRWKFHSHKPFSFSLTFISIDEQNKSTFYHAYFFAINWITQLAPKTLTYWTGIWMREIRIKRIIPLNVNFFFFFQMLTTYTLSICLLFHFQIFFLFVLSIHLSFFSLHLKLWLEIISIFVFNRNTIIK